MNKLTKNFYFFENEKFNSKWKEKIIENISLAESFYNKPSESIENISNALNCILNDFIEKNNIIDNFDSSKFTLKEKINKINDTGRMGSSYLFHIMREVKNARNFKAHSIDDGIDYKITINDVCQRLKQLFYISKHLYEFDKEQEFEEKFYTNKYKNNEISAIPNDEEIKNSKEYENINPDLKIEMNSLKSWLSIQKAKIVIPIYQRRYEWKEKNIKILFDDILKTMENNSDHYFGTIAQKKQSSNDLHSPDIIKIIDGQQRLTTSFLFLSAIRQITLERHYKESFFEIDWYNDIIEKLFYKEKLNLYFYNPGGTQENNDCFEKIVNNNRALSYEKLGLKETNQYSKNYKYILELLNEKIKSNTELIYFVTTFINKFKVGSLSFNSNSFSNKKEMEIFENLNSKGLELSLRDFMKNHLFNFCSDKLLETKFGEENVPRKYNEIIASSGVEDEIDKFYANISEFIKGDELPKDDREKFIIVKESIDILLEKWENKDIERIKDFELMMEELQNYMYLYMESLNKGNKFINFIQIEKIIDIISDLKKRRIFAYFLYIIYNKIQDLYDNKFDFIVQEQSFKLKKSEIKSIQELFLSIVKFLIRTKVITKQGDSNIKRCMFAIAQKYKNTSNIKNIEELCKLIIKDINKEEQNDIYSFIEFKRSLENNSSHNQIVELLILTEHIMNDSLFGGGEAIKRDNLSIEHILPQTIDEWLAEVSENDRKEWIEQANSNMEKIGNYLILTKLKNSKAKNYVFSKKQKEVYKDLSSPLYKNDNDLIDVSKKTEWTFDDIEKRTKELIQYITKNVITE